MKTMGETYLGEGNKEIDDHLCCDNCGHCIDCGDCSCNAEETS